MDKGGQDTLVALLAWWQLYVPPALIVKKLCILPHSVFHTTLEITVTVSPYTAG
jgi:hypothetical protein